MLTEVTIVAMIPTIEALTDELRSRASARRRSAAKQLRKLGVPAAGSALLAALQNEVHDARTWETQYQMVMALGECGYKEALPFLRVLAARELKNTMVLVGISDALVRLGRTADHDPNPLLDILAKPAPWELVDGALRAVAMLRMRFKAETVEHILQEIETSKVEALLFWAAAACAGWSGPAVHAFLTRCLQVQRSDIREAAQAALQGKYKKWRPL